MAVIGNWKTAVCTIFKTNNKMNIEVLHVCCDYFCHYYDIVNNVDFKNQFSAWKLFWETAMLKIYQFN